ncbi:MAG: DUF1566 domain-containing protein [Rhodoferax sp.]|nr:DUF1566 domain-containing protein [Rhodoferax sp.]
MAAPTTTARSYSYAVRLVRGGQSFGSLLGITRPTSDYVDNRNGTVTHTPTNLTWKRCPELQTWTGSTCSGTATNFTFDQATALADTTTFAGQSDWRLPTGDELLSLVDYSTYGPAINSSIFPATPGSSFWSGSPYAYYSGYAWSVYFSNGYASYNNRSSSNAVRLVRGGQSFGSFVLAVSKSGTGTGTVTGSAAGINCGNTCSAALASGTSVTLTATPATGSNFTGWSGSCSGRGSCTVSMDAVKSVTAFFMAAPTTSKLQPNADGTVTDLKTGLTWMRCSMGQVWNGSTCLGTAATYTFDQANALTGTTTFANQSDWRMPNIRELQSIVDRSVYGLAIDSVVFPNTPGSFFWSGSPVASSSDYAWYVYFYDGYAGYNLRSGSSAVRLVRGGQSFAPLLGIARPTSDYVNHGNGTVTHTPTNLTWKRCPELQTWTGSTCSGMVGTYTFDQANALTGTTTFAGQNDWRLPTEDELSSLVDYSTHGPAINSSLFQATPDSYFWSGSPYANNSGNAWYVYFGNGYATYNGRTDNFAARLVRGGQSFGSFVLAVSKSGTGTGTVTGSAAGINCGSTCSSALTSGASVTLTAAPATGSTFSGWSGSCSGTGTCTVSMTAAQNVTATFTNACTYALNANSATAAATAGTGSISVISSCAWTATSNASWITITAGSSGSGNGTVAYAVAANTGTTQRTGTLTIAGKTFTVTQAAGSTVTAPVCTLSANPSSITSGGSSTLTATCNPTATSYIWMGGSCAGTSGASCTVSPTATTTYSVQGSNAGGTNQAAGATVTVTANTASYTVPGTLGNDVFVLTAGNNYYGGAGNDTFIISPNTLLGGVTAKIIDTEGDNLIQLVDGMTVAASSFYSDAAQITLSNGAIVQILGASKFKFQVGANALAGDTAAVLTYSEFVTSLGATLSGTLPASGTAGYVVPAGFTQAAAPVPSVAGSSYTVPGTLGGDVLAPSGGNNYLGGGGNDVYIISPYTLSGLVTAKIIDSEGSNVIQLVGGLTIASSTFYNNAVQLTLSSGASVQILGASGFSYQLGANAPAGVVATSLSYAQFAAALGASVPAGASAVSGSANFVVPSP